MDFLDKLNKSFIENGVVASSIVNEYMDLLKEEDDKEPTTPYTGKVEALSALLKGKMSSVGIINGMLKEKGGFKRVHDAVLKAGDSENSLRLIGFFSDILNPSKRDKIATLLARSWGGNSAKGKVTKALAKAASGFGKDLWGNIVENPDLLDNENFKNQLGGFYGLLTSSDAKSIGINNDFFKGYAKQLGIEQAEEAPEEEESEDPTQSEIEKIRATPRLDRNQSLSDRKSKVKASPRPTEPNVEPGSPIKQKNRGLQFNPEDVKARNLARGAKAFSKEKPKGTVGGPVKSDARDDGVEVGGSIEAQNDQKASEHARKRIDIIKRAPTNLVVRVRGLKKGPDGTKIPAYKFANIDLSAPYWTNIESPNESHVWEYLSAASNMAKSGEDAQAAQEYNQLFSPNLRHAVSKTEETPGNARAYFTQYIGGTPKDRLLKAYQRADPSDNGSLSGIISSLANKDLETLLKVARKPQLLMKYSNGDVKDMNKVVDFNDILNFVTARVVEYQRSSQVNESIDRVILEKSVEEMILEKKLKAIAKAFGGPLSKADIRLAQMSLIYQKLAKSLARDPGMLHRVLKKSGSPAYQEYVKMRGGEEAREALQATNPDELEKAEQTAKDKDQKIAKRKGQAAWGKDVRGSVLSPKELAQKKREFASDQPGAGDFTAGRQARFREKAPKREKESRAQKVFLDAVKLSGIAASPKARRSFDNFLHRNLGQSLSTEAYSLMYKVSKAMGENNLIEFVKNSLNDKEDGLGNHKHFKTAINTINKAGGHKAYKNKNFMGNKTNNRMAQAEKDIFKSEDEKDEDLVTRSLGHSKDHQEKERIRSKAPLATPSTREARRKQSVILNAVKSSGIAKPEAMKAFYQYVEKTHNNGNMSVETYYLLGGLLKAVSNGNLAQFVKQNTSEQSHNPNQVGETTSLLDPKSFSLIIKLLHQAGRSV
tara:strand:+ start:49003 stop:51819 length:2817 start_codon:yes stop_codon:yes gene_type:complete